MRWTEQMAEAIVWLCSSTSPATSTATGNSTSNRIRNVYIPRRGASFQNTHNHICFTPKHGSWLNIVEISDVQQNGAKHARGIRVASKQELIDRIHLYFQHINVDPVIFRWKYRMDETPIG